MQQSGQLNSPMVAEEVPPVACSETVSHRPTGLLPEGSGSSGQGSEPTAPPPRRSRCDRRLTPTLSNPSERRSWSTRKGRLTAEGRSRGLHRVSLHGALSSWEPSAAAPRSRSTSTVRGKDSGVSPTTFVSRPSRHARPYMACYGHFSLRRAENVDRRVRSVASRHNVVSAVRADGRRAGLSSRTSREQTTWTHRVWRPSRT